MGLRMQVRAAIASRYSAQPGFGGPDWRVGRLLHENVYRGVRLTDMNEAACRLALEQLRGNA
jgi:hypothetical protein